MEEGHGGTRGLSMASYLTSIDDFMGDRKGRHTRHVLHVPLTSWNSRTWYCRPPYDVSTILHLHRGGVDRLDCLILARWHCVDRRERPAPKDLRFGFAVLDRP